jgi:APA family basic amino acid/polyamine antiporter
MGGNAAIATIFVSYASVFWPSLGTNNALAFTLGLSVIWVLTLANCAGARESGIIQLVTTVLKFVPLLLIGLIGLFYMNAGNFTPFDPNHVTLAGHWHAISFAATLTLWAFLGLESATVPAEEVKNPEKTLPRATILGTVATTGLYVLATVAIMGVIPAATLVARTPRSPTPPARSSAPRCWHVADKLIAAVAMISTFEAERLDPDPGPRAAGGGADGSSRRRSPR